MTTTDDSNDGGGGAIHTVPAHFDPDDIEDDANPYPRPLYLASLPLLACQRAAGAARDAGAATLAYGGDDGRVYLLRDGGADAAAPAVVRTFDDEVRALAVSPDGRRVAVGFDDGSTVVFAYDGAVPPGDHHPFVPPAALRGPAAGDDGAAYPSQTQDDDDDDDEKDGGAVEFPGPRMDAAIRQLAFDPRGGGGEGKAYHLAVASESGHQPLVVVDARDAASVATRHLGDRSGEEHEGGGVRSVAYSVRGGAGGPEGGVLLATLGMDGRAVVWDVSGADDPALLWDVCHRDLAAAVPKADGGDPVADAGDKACRVVWDAVAARGGGGAAEEETLGVLYLPGQTSVQYRLCPLSRAGAAPPTAEVAARLRGPPTHVHDAARGHRDTIVALAVPPLGARGQRLVTGGRDGRLLLWDLDLRGAAGEARELPLARGAPARGVPPITGVAWEREGEVTVAWADGTATTVPVPEEGQGEEGDGEEGPEEEAAEAREGRDEDGEGLATQPAEVHQKKVAFEEDSDEEGWQVDRPGDIVVPSEEKEKERAAEKWAAKRKKKADAARFVDDEAEDGDDDVVQYDDVVAPAAKTGAAPDAEEGGDDGVGDDDVSFGSPEDPPDGFARASAPSRAAAPYRQPPFAPSSTPVADARRLLCWNHVGVAALRPADPDDPGAGLGLVDVHFTEAGPGGRPPFTFTDNLGFSVAALGEEGGLFAADPAEDDDEEEDDEEEAEAMDRTTRNIYLREKAARRRARRGGAYQGSQVFFSRFETFGRPADKDWVMALPGGERAVGCAVGRGWAAVVTSRRFLRLFTAGGVQGPVHWLPGDPVTVVGRDRFVAVFHHAAAGPSPDGTQALGYSVRDGLTGATVAEGDVAALSAGSELAWAGFTDKCALATLDSAGMLSVLARGGDAARGTGGNWMPVLDTLGLRRTQHDRHWPVEVHGGKLVCVPLRGGKEYPDAARRPVTTTVPLRVPMAMGLTVKTDPLEESSIRAAFAVNQEKMLDDYLVSQGEANEEDIEEEYIQKCTQVDRVTLKLFASFVKSGKVERGFDLAQRLHNEKSFDIAISMADRAGHRKLSDRVEEVKDQRYPPLGEDSEDEGSVGSESDRSVGVDEDEPVVATRQARMEMMLRREISPEGGGGLSTPQQPRRSREDGAEDSEGGGYDSTDGESPPREALKRKFEEDHRRAAADSRKRVNPFAKKKMESPARGIMQVLGSPTKMTLSRASTFSAKSRQKQRKGKQIV